MATTVGGGGLAHASSDPRCHTTGQITGIPLNLNQINGFHFNKIEEQIINLIDDRLARIKLPDYSMPICWHNQPPYLPLNGGFGMQYPTFPYPMQPYNTAYPGQYNYYNIPQNMANGYSNGAHFIQNNIAPQIEENKSNDCHLQSNIIVKENRPKGLLRGGVRNNEKEYSHCKYWDKTDQLVQEMRNNFDNSAEKLKEALSDAIYVAFHPDDASDSDSSNDELDTQKNLPIILAAPNNNEEKIVDNQSMVNSEQGALNMPDDLNVEEFSSKNYSTDIAEVGYIDMAYYWEASDTEGYTEKDAESFYSEINPLASDDFDTHNIPSFSTTGLRRWTALQRIGN